MSQPSLLANGASLCQTHVNDGGVGYSSGGGLGSHTRLLKAFFIHEDVNLRRFVSLYSLPGRGIDRQEM